MARRAAHDEDLNHEVPLQAIVLADAFTRRFHPITLEMPQVLFPLANTPMLDYTIEFLSTAGVKEVIVFSVSHAEQVAEYLNSSRWLSPSCPIKVTPRANSDANSAGAALRDIFAEGLITSDFVLVYGDVVANVSLAEALAAHRARKAEHCIMTSVFREVRPGHPSRSPEDEIIVGVDACSRELLYYERAGESRYADIELGLLGDCPALTLRTDLLDCHIDICSPEVLLTLTDHFDLDDMRAHFLKFVLAGNEVTMAQFRVFAHVVSAEYAARARCLQTYASVTRDVVRRWAYPLVPDSNLAGSTFRHQRSNIYKERDVRISATSRIGADVVLGAGTVVADGAVLERSVVGRGCVIGVGAVVRDSIIWNNVVVSDGARVDAALLCDCARVGSHATIEPNCIVSLNCVVGPGIKLLSGSRLTLAERADDKGDSEWEDSDSGDEPLSPEAEAAAQKWAAANTAAGGVGALYLERKADQRPSSLALRSAQAALAKAPQDDESASSDVDDGDAAPVADEQEYNDPDRFNAEVFETVKRAAEEGIEIRNVVLEINGLKFAYDVNFADVGNALVPAIVSLIRLDEAAAAIVAKAKATIGHWAPLLEKFRHSRDDELEIADALMQFCIDHEAARRIFHIVLQLLFENEVLSAEAILAWEPEALNRRLDEDRGIEAERPIVAQMLAKAAPFLAFLRENGDDDGDDDDYESGDE